MVHRMDEMAHDRMHEMAHDRMHEMAHDRMHEVAHGAIPMCSLADSAHSNCSEAVTVTCLGRNQACASSFDLNASNLAWQCDLLFAVHSPMTHTPMTHTPMTHTPMTYTPMTHTPMTHTTNG
jgi:hypothetical protein